MDQQEFMDHHGTRHPGVDLITQGPASQRVWARVSNEDQTRALIASFFWRAFLASNAYLRALKLLKASPLAASQARTVVVPRPSINRFDLLVLDPGMGDQVEPRSLEIGPQIFPRNEVDAGAVSAAQGGVPPSIGVDYVSLARETASNACGLFMMVLAPQPRSELLFVPEVALPVDDSCGSLSTAGAIVECVLNPGTIGVTAALHGIVGASSVLVDGKSGTVLRTNALCDSAFVRLERQPSAKARSTKGVMSGILPRGQQGASFNGITTARTTVITGWDPQLPNPSAYRQALLYTGRDAQPGDSGAVLVTDDDWIVGFAFERSLPGQNPVHCSWIWADSVFKTLNIKLI